MKARRRRRPTPEPDRTGPTSTDAAVVKERSDAPAAERAPRTLPRLLAIWLALSALLTLLVAAFTWPPSDFGPRDLPLVVAGPAPAVSQVEAQLAHEAGADAFEVTVVANRTAAEDAIRQRDAYGGIVVGTHGPEVLTASAASAQVAQMLTQMAGQMGQQSGATVPAHDVVPAPDGDPRGLIFGSGAFPLAVGGIILGAVTSIALRRTRDRALVAIGAAVAAGLSMTAILQYGLDALGGHYLANAGVVTLGLLAVALPIIGLRHLIGPAGIGVVALLVLLVGNPLSGITSAPELLPLGQVGQFLPPGAAGSALRGTAFFDGARAGVPLLVLAAWALVGHLLTLIPRREGQQSAAP